MSGLTCPRCQLRYIGPNWLCGCCLSCRQIPEGGQDFYDNHSGGKCVKPEKSEECEGQCQLAESVGLEHASCAERCLWLETFPAEQADDAIAALAFWSESVRPTLGDLPVEGLRVLRDQYVEDVQANQVALAQLREWWRTYGSASAGSGELS